MWLPWPQYLWCLKANKPPTHYPSAHAHFTSNCKKKQDHAKLWLAGIYVLETCFLPGWKGTNAMAIKVPGGKRQNFMNFCNTCSLAYQGYVTIWLHISGNCIVSIHVSCQFGYHNRDAGLMWQTNVDNSPQSCKSLPLHHASTKAQSNHHLPKAPTCPHLRVSTTPS